MSLINSHRLTCLAVAILTIAASLPILGQSQSRDHSINGSGVSAVPDNYFPGTPGFATRQSISARQRANGEVDGLVFVQITGLGPDEIRMTIQVTCLSVADHTAYWGGIVVSSNVSSPGFTPGTEAVGFVFDGPSAGTDLSWSGPSMFWAPNGETCADHPLLPPVPVVKGHFEVR